MQDNTSSNKKLPKDKYVNAKNTLSSFFVNNIILISSPKRAYIVMIVM